MAKDGTTRGGRRVRSGTKPEPLVDKIQKGRSARVMEFPVNNLPISDDMGYVADLDGADMPEPSAYLSAMQRDGQPLGADIIYRETVRWLKDRGCDRLVNNRLVESYSEAFARYIQCSEAVSSYGLLGKHPTTKAPIASPFVQMMLAFQKQANLLWYEIFDVVKQNSTTAFEGDPQDDAMEMLLRLRGNLSHTSTMPGRTLRIRSQSCGPPFVSSGLSIPS